MSSAPTFVLVHGPLAGPSLWAPVAEVLRARGAEVCVPALRTAERDGGPYWLAHATAVARALDDTPPDRPLALVGHGGGGALLPAIRRALGRPVAAYLFVDAAIPRDGASRLDLFATSAEADGFRAAAVRGCIPPWTEDDLRAAIPDPGRRQRLVAELRPLPLAVYEEPLPVFRGWPDAPCGYLGFGESAAYVASVAHALANGWAYRELPGGHFHPLVAPDAVAWALRDLAGRLGLARRGP